MKALNLQRKPLEQEIKNSILEWFDYQTDAMVWPNDSVGIFDVRKGVFRKKKSRFHRNGVADILGIWKGQPLAIEVKTKKGVVSEEQKAFLLDFTSHGGIAFVARCLQDVIDELKKQRSS